MRGHKALIQEAEVMAMSPEAVAEFLKRRAGQSEAEARDDPTDEETEQALLSRRSPLIDLGLARYGRHMSTVAGLFQAAEPGKAIRLACLCNTSVTLQFAIWRKFPVGLFNNELEMAQWLGQATGDELQALFQNPALDDGFLRDLLERGKSWRTVSDNTLCLIISILANNPRMRTPRQDDYMDGYADYSYGAVFDAAWKLAESVEPTENWAMALGWLYEQLETDAFSVDTPLLVTARWRNDPADVEASRKEAKENAKGWLVNKQRVRKGLGRLALHKDSKLLDALLTNDDIALRCSAYASGRLKPNQLSAAYQRDGELMFDVAVHNLWLWRAADTRAALKEIAWAVVHNDKHSDLLAANIYNSIRKGMRRKYPDWFRDEEDPEPVIDASEAPATKANIAALAELSRSVGRIDRRLRVVCGIAAAAVSVYIAERVEVGLGQQWGGLISGIIFLIVLLGTYTFLNHVFDRDAD